MKRINPSALFGYLKKSKYRLLINVFLFNLFLLFVPGNKLVIFFYFIFFIYNIYLFRSTLSALIVTYISSHAIFTGKAFAFQLIPEALLQTDKPYTLFLIISPHFIFALLLIFQFIFKLRFLGRELKKNLYIVLFIIFLLSSSLISRFPQISSFIFLNYLGFISLYFLSLFQKQNKQNPKSLLLQSLLGLGIFESLLAFLQFIKQSPLGASIESVATIPSNQKLVDVNPYVQRVVGTFSHPNELAFFILPLLVFTVTFLFNNYQNSKNRNFYFTLTMLFFTTLILTQSRSAWLTFFIIFTVQFYILNKKLHLSFLKDYFSKIKKALFILFPVFIFAFFPRIMESMETFSASGSYSGRIIQIKEAWAGIFQFPFFGTGLGLGVYEIFLLHPKGLVASAPSPPHIIYFHLLLEVGVFALLSFSAFIAKQIEQSIKKLPKLSVSHKIFRLACLFAVFSVLINGFFQPVMEATFKPFIIFLVLSGL